MINYNFAKLAGNITFKSFDQGDDVKVITNNNGVIFTRWFSIYKASINETFDQASERVFKYLADQHSSHIILKFKGSD
tara:strand:- start:1241 stop:1474 length:234 start_codon:yes stop_codon:yes gene_type:complete